MHNEMWRDVVSESVRRLGLLQLSGCICHLSRMCFLSENREYNENVKSDIKLRKCEK